VEYSSKTYMILVLITFIALGVALGFAWAEWNELNDPTTFVEVNFEQI
jgi:hypothetical protein